MPAWIHLTSQIAAADGGPLTPGRPAAFAVTLQDDAPPEVGTALPASVALTYLDALTGETLSAPGRADVLRVPAAALLSAGAVEFALPVGLLPDATKPWPAGVTFRGFAGPGGVTVHVPYGRLGPGQSERYAVALLVQPGSPLAGRPAPAARSWSLGAAGWALDPIPTTTPAAPALTKSFRVPVTAAAPKGGTP